jgi:hypothetical protein
MKFLQSYERGLLHPIDEWSELYIYEMSKYMCSIRCEDARFDDVSKNYDITPPFLKSVNAEEFKADILYNIRHAPDGSIIKCYDDADKISIEVIPNGGSLVDINHTLTKLVDVQDGLLDNVENSLDEATRELAGIHGCLARLCELTEYAHVDTVGPAHIQGIEDAILALVEVMKLSPQKGKKTEVR